MFPSLLNTYCACAKQKAIINGVRYIERALPLRRTQWTSAFSMAVASGPAGPVLAGPVFAVKTAHAQGYVNGRGSAMRCDHSVSRSIFAKYRVLEGIMRHQNTFLCNLGQKGEQNLKLGVNIS